MLAGFGGGVALALAVALASFLAIGRLQEDGRQVAHTQEVIGVLEGLSASAAAARTAMLGYAVSADTEQLADFEVEVLDLKGDLARVRALIGSPALAAHLPALGVLVEQRLAHQRFLIDLRRREGLAAVQAALAGREDDAFDHAIRRLIAGLEEGERARLKRRLDRSERNARLALLAVGLGSLLSVVLAGLGLYSVRRGFAASRRAREALESANAALDRRVAERTAQLHASRELLERIVASAPSAIFAMDRAHRYTVTNPAHLVICGRSAAEVLGHTEREVYGPVSGEQLWAANEAIMTEGLTRQFEVELGRADGSQVPAFTTKFPLRDPRGQVVGLGGVGTDISERRAAEEALRKLNAELEQRVAERTAEAVAANAAKSRFLAQMSHEIRNPLNAMLGLAQVLESESLTAAQRQMVQRIRAAGRTLLGIINDVLDFSKIEAGQLRVECWPFEVRPILAQVENLMGELARAKGLALRIEVPEGLTDRLLGDPLRIEQVLVNLVGNGVKFTERGQVRIAVSVLERSPGALRLRFEVEDTGIGIPPDRLPGLGTPFAQSDSSITRRFGGTGLGLSISKHLVGLMGGLFGCDSTPGVGSRFWFELPCARTTGAPAPPPALPVVARETGAEPGPRLCGLHCLVVDDSEMNRDVLERALLREGARVTLAADGSQALACLGADPAGFSAVLMDIQMPVMDGLTATRAIRAEPSWAGLPVIAFSAAVLAPQRQAARDAGVDDFLAKPVDLEELVATLHRVRAGRVAGEPVVPLPPRAPPAVEFPAIPGLDTRRAAMLLGGDRAFFIGLLRQFTGRFGGLSATLREDLAQGHAAAAARRLHTVRGIAGNIGAQDLANTAAALETALATDGAESATLLGQLEGQLAGLLEAIAPWLEAAPVVGAAVGPLDPLALKALCQALARRDLAARHLFKDLHPALAVHFGEGAAAALAESIAHLRFGEAQAVLERGPQPPPVAATDLRHTPAPRQ